MNKKQLYSAPEAELLVIRIEENFLQSPTFSSKGTEVMSVEEEEDF